jgi:hypothetical protein
VRAREGDFHLKNKGLGAKYNWLSTTKQAKRAPAERKNFEGYLGAKSKPRLTRPSETGLNLIRRGLSGTNYLLAITLAKK